MFISVEITWQIYGDEGHGPTSLVVTMFGERCVEPWRVTLAVTKLHGNVSDAEENLSMR
jgi:hypothetical protein